MEPITIKTPDITFTADMSSTANPHLVEDYWVGAKGTNQETDMSAEPKEPSIVLTFSGDEVELSFNELKRLKSMLEEKFPEDYI
jgi:hypothetical protein